MTEDWNPTIRSADGEELEVSSWDDYRNGPQETSAKSPDKRVTIPVRAATRERLREAKAGGETFDQLLTRFLDVIEEPDE